MSEELRECAHCGSEAQIDRMGTSRVSMQISCTDCGAHMETGETWIDEHSSWNTRASDTKIAELEKENAELKKALERISAWDELNLEFRLDYGSNGQRDYYRNIANEQLAKLGSK